MKRIALLIPAWVFILTYLALGSCSDDAPGEPQTVKCVFLNGDIETFTSLPGETFDLNNSGCLTAGWKTYACGVRYFKPLKSN